jgi:hypothetical protein
LLKLAESLRSLAESIWKSAESRHKLAEIATKSAESPNPEDLLPVGKVANITRNQANSKDNIQDTHTHTHNKGYRNRNHK